MAEAPPYGTYGTFDKFVEQLSATAAPDQIDRSMLSSLSGGDQTALLAGLRFLGLIEGDDGKTTDSFHGLVRARKSGTEEWKAALGQIVKPRYAPIIGDVNIETTTKAKIQKCFGDAGVATGQMMDKSIRFYLKALEQSGGTVSPHLKGMRGRIRRTTSGTSRRKSSRRPSSAESSDSSAPKTSPKADQVPDGFSRLPIPGLDGAFIQYPADLTRGHITLLEGGVAYLATSVKVREEEENTK
jgi:hypothetical protein